MSISVSGSQITFNDASTQNTAATGFGFKNRIINGAMAIDQRNAGASQSITSGSVAYTVDRWQLYSIGSTTTGQRISNGSGGYRYQMTGAAGNTNIVFLQRIESNNSADLANTTVTLSADIANSTLTTVSWIAYYANSTDNFGTINASPNTTTIASGNFTVTSTVTRYSTQISIPSAATTGLQIALYTTSQTSGTFTVGNVQLEKGSTATSFDYRPYGTELALCQRYYEKSFDDGTAPANGANSTSLATGNGSSATVAGNNSLFGGPIRFAVQKRTAATITAYGNNSGYWAYVSTSASSTVNWSANTVLFANQGAGGFSVLQNVTNNVYYSIFGHWTASAEL